MASRNEFIQPRDKASPHVIDENASTSTYPVRNIDAESPKPKLGTAPPKHRKEQAPKTEKPSTKAVSTNDAAMMSIYPAIHRGVITCSYPTVSRYCPSAHELFEIVHACNQLLAGNVYLTRIESLYHPTLINIYYAIVFYVQSLRAMNEAGIITRSQRRFLMKLTEQFPLELFPIAGPMVLTIQALCAIQLEDQKYTMVCPTIPDPIGPATAEIPHLQPLDLCLPDVPRLIGMMNCVLARAPNDQDYDNFDRFNPLDGATNAAPRILGGLTYPLPADWQGPIAWNLTRPGLTYPPECDRAHHQAIFNRRSNYSLPIIAAATPIATIESFLGLNNDMVWLTPILAVAGSHADFFLGRRSLNDINPIGSPASLLVGSYTASTPVLVQPTSLYDAASKLKLSAKYQTTIDTMSNLDLKVGALSQLNIKYPPNHPYAPNIGTAAGNRTTGPIWDRNIITCFTSIDYNPSLNLRSTIKQDMYIPKGTENRPEN